MTGRYLRRSAEQWHALIERQSASGLSQGAFCDAEELSLSTFRRWKQLLAEREIPNSRRAKQQADAALSAPLFTALQVGNDGNDEPGDAGHA